MRVCPNSNEPESNNQKKILSRYRVAEELAHLIGRQFEHEGALLGMDVRQALDLQTNQSLADRRLVIPLR